MRPLPPWILKGAVVGAQGGTERVAGMTSDSRPWHARRRVLVAGLGGPTQTSSLPLWWNWNSIRTSIPTGTVRHLMADYGARIDDLRQPVPRGRRRKENRRRNLFAEARREGYLVENRAGRAVHGPDNRLLRGPRGPDEPAGPRVDKGRDQSRTDRQRRLRVDGRLRRDTAPRCGAFLGRGPAKLP